MLWGGSPGSSSSDIFHGMHWKEQTFQQLQPLKAFPLLEQLGALEKKKVVCIMAGGQRGERTMNFFKLLEFSYFAAW